MGVVLRRIAATLPVMGVVALLVFLLIHLAPGDPAALIAGDLASTDDITRLRTAAPPPASPRWPRWSSSPSRSRSARSRHTGPARGSTGW